MKNIILALLIVFSFSVTAYLFFFNCLKPQPVTTDLYQEPIQKTPDITPPPVPTLSPPQTPQTWIRQQYTNA